ncbi:MAG: ABC transporter permease [Actinobacteria bacterium]|nr:ABC transporter permease [Actinomycetota bacterium]
MDELTALLASTIRNATPLAFAALGGLFSERSGVINIGLEGMMLISAFAGVAGAQGSGSTVFGLLVALAVGLLFGLVHAVASITFEADQIISGIAINLLALGGTGLLMVLFFGSGGTSPRIEPFSRIDIPLLADIPIVGAIFSQSVLVYLLYALVPITWWVLYRSRFGLRLRAVGEVPEAVDTAGVNVFRLRYIGVGLSGMLAGLGGAFLSMSLLSAFTEGMTNGRGFIALAALIFGRWNPVGAFAAALLFGFAQAVVFRGGIGFTVPQEFIEMFPYLLVIVALVGFGGRAVPPAASGQPYRKE